jgi:hypothetical protein
MTSRQPLGKRKLLLMQPLETQAPDAMGVFPPSPNLVHGLLGRGGGGAKGGGGWRYVFRAVQERHHRSLLLLFGRKLPKNYFYLIKTFKNI